MIRGLYTSGWSLVANSKKLDVVSNNLANADTNGYKKDTVVFETFPEVMTRRINDTPSILDPSGKVGTMRLGSDIGEIFTSYDQGRMQKTGSDLDFAIENSNLAFFTIGKPDEAGNVTEYLTRNGSFTINAQNQLVTKDGYYVMGTNGPITLNGDNFVIEKDGSIIQNGAVINKLSIKEFVNSDDLKKIGENLIQGSENAEQREFSGAISQGFLEGSNISVVKEMVDMISVMRSYEANQKMLQAQDSTLEKLVNQVGSLK